MDIQHVSTPSLNPNAEGDDLTILVDNETAIRIQNYGTGAYRWRVDSTGYDPKATLVENIGEPKGEDGFWTAAESFGVLATWWEPKTWAHVVMNVLNNQ